MTFQRAQDLFGIPLPFAEFGETVERHPHHWHDTEAVRETAHRAYETAHALQRAQRFVIRVRNAENGPEYASLVFEAEGGIVTLKEWTSG